MSSCHKRSAHLLAAQVLYTYYSIFLIDARIVSVFVRELPGCRLFG